MRPGTGYSSLPIQVAWSTTTTTVNAIWEDTENSITFPAGILQIPIFSGDLPSYVSFGAYGSAAGHELTHGFDNIGALYDERGAYREWWDNATVAKFNKKTQCFVDQYSKYSVVDQNDQRIPVDGKLTAKENIADAGGLAVSFAAWQKLEAQKPSVALPGLERFINGQLFFLAFGVALQCGKDRPEDAAERALTDPHSSRGVRMLGVLENSAAFKKAFGCQEKEPVCEIW
jgi:endothelin-converting enzyme